ncbi:MAG: class I SAM-dependent methyltransferase [Pseudomonadota bacterium]
MMANPAFWTRIADSYAASPVRDPDAYEATLERVRSYLRKDDCVLELGAGTGTTSTKLADAVAHYTVTDFSEGMIRIAKERTAGFDNITVRQAEASDPGTWDNGYEAVMAFSLLHLVDDLDATLRSVHRMVKPGGYFISKTVCLTGKWTLLKAVLPVMRLFDKAPAKVAFLRPSELEGRIEAAGFRIIETGNYPNSPIARFVVAEKL